MKTRFNIKGASIVFNPQVLLSALVPEAYRPLLNCVSPSAFRVIDWKQIASDAPVLARRVTTGDGVADLAASLAGRLPARVRVAHGGVRGEPLGSGDGDAVLELYFRQLWSDRGLFLDLRASAFSLAEDATILWRPGGLWTQMTPEFIAGMRLIYEGYYQHDKARLREGLLRVGLVKVDFPPDVVDEVERMILHHVGGEVSNQTFKVSQFTTSFENLFKFLLRHKIALPADFLYLGIYLAGLYLHLEALGGAYDVGAAFNRSRDRETGPGA